MLVLSFCFNTLVVTYFNIYRAIRAALLGLSGTAVSLTLLVFSLLFAQYTYAGTPFPATLLGFNVDGWPLEPTVASACLKIKTKVYPGYSLKLVSISDMSCYSANPTPACAPGYTCTFDLYSPNGPVTQTTGDVPAIYTCPPHTFIGTAGYFNNPGGPPFTPYDTCVDPCPKGTKINSAGQCVAPLFPPKGGDCPTLDHPIRIGTGNKWLIETDIAIYSGISFTRHYNLSDFNGGSIIGKGWLHSYAMSVASSQTDASVFRADGKLYSYSLVNSLWTTDTDITDVLTELKDSGGIRIGWTYKIDATGEVETYDANGKLVSIKNRADHIQTLDYSVPTTSANIASNSGLLIRVTDHLGHALHFTYDTYNRISTMTNPAGGVYTYAYSTDSNNNLVSVTYPDSKTKTYHYENTTFPNTLTGITDENASRYMTYTYDSNGRAIDEISPTFGINVNHYALSYNPGVSTVVTDPRGSVRTYNFTTILGVVKSTGQSQPAGSGCASSAAALTYDVNGNIASRTDFKGFKTTYAYDLARNLETSRTEGLTSAGAATAATRTITSSWHPTWRLPLVTSEYTGATATGTALRSTTNVYDSKGNITSITEADPVRSTSRTTTITYTYSSAVPGLVLTKVIDGPRTDVSDISTYNYYPHDATCAPSTATPIIDPITNTSPANLGCRGQLQSMSNAINQTTTYDRYNHHGQVEQMTDANGLVTTSTYDLRQRLLTRTVGTETTSLTYDNVGQVTQLTLPDASQLNYSYDAAHRLTDVQDSLGNKVHYTLDTEGNRTNETTTDPANVLTKTLSRSYDALNRLQQVTGVE